MKKIISTSFQIINPSFSIDGFEKFTDLISGEQIPYLVQNEIKEQTGNYICPITLEEITEKHLNEGKIFAMTSMQTNKKQPIVFIIKPPYKGPKLPRLVQEIKNKLNGQHPITKAPLNVTNIFQVRPKHWLSNSKYPYVLHSLEDHTISDWLTGLNRLLGIEVKGVNPADVHTYRESAILIASSSLIYALLNPELRFYFSFILLLMIIIPERHQGQR